MTAIPRRTTRQKKSIRMLSRVLRPKELGKRLEEMEKDIEESALARAVGGMREGESGIVG